MSREANAAKTWKPCLTGEQCRILKAYIDSGHVAHLYPRKGVISLNGHRALPIAEAVRKMRAYLDTKPSIGGLLLP